MATNTPVAKKPSGKLTEILVRNHVIDQEILGMAEEQAKAENIRVERYLVSKKLVSGGDMTLALAQYLSMPPMRLVNFKPNEVLVEAFPKEALTKYQAVPLARVGKTMTIALADPFDIFALDELKMVSGLDLVPVVAAEAEVQELLAKLFTVDSNALDMDEIMKASDSDVEALERDEEEKQSLEDMMKEADDAPVVKLVNMIIIEALRSKACDIHIEPQENYVRLRYRVDGVLLERPHMQKSMQNAIISRIKIMSDLDIGEQRIPQDGRCRITAMGKKVDLRVSILPTIFGGKVVMRVLDKSALFPNLGALGLDEISYKAMSYAIQQPHGIVLVTGPTGSGKTTTLYSCLQDLNTPNINITTCEDPVEYQLQGINQVRIVTDVGMTFSAALRAILRQDPDVLLVGEIRDAETCEIAIKAALTGHLVLSTLHTNDAAGAVVRLVDMGIEPFLVASSVILAQAQRLFRKLCPVCKKECAPDREMLKEYGIDPTILDGAKIYTHQGCPKCNNMGYSGRGSIMEVLSVNDPIRGAIIQGGTAMEIRELAIKSGMVSLLMAGLNRVRMGDTSLEVAIQTTGGGD